MRDDGKLIQRERLRSERSRRVDVGEKGRGAGHGRGETAQRSNHPSSLAHTCRDPEIVFADVARVRTTGRWRDSLSLLGEGPGEGSEPHTPRRTTAYLDRDRATPPAPRAIIIGAANENPFANPARRLTHLGWSRYKLRVPQSEDVRAPSEGDSPDVLYVITDLELGGVPLHLHRLALAMRDRGLRVAVVSLARPGPVGDRMKADGIPVYSCDGRGGWDVRVIPRLASIIRRTQPRVIHALLFHANLASRWAAQSVGFPADRLVCEIQTVEVERRWHLWLDNMTYDLCRFTVGNSPSVIEHLAERGRIPRDRLRLVRGGIEPAPLRQAPASDRTALGAPPDARLVLWAGRLDPVKGLALLLDAFRAVSQQVDAHLCLAGGGPLRGELERQITRLALGDRVHLLGPRSDVPSLLRAADVFVFPSRTEGLPNALLEAMATGCPIVTTDVPGCRDLIEHDRTGLLVPYADTTSLSAALLRLLEDRATARRLGREASETVERRWHICQTHDAYAVLYAELLTQNR